MLFFDVLLYLVLDLNKLFIYKFQQFYLRLKICIFLKNLKVNKSVINNIEYDKLSAKIFWLIDIKKVFKNKIRFKISLKNINAGIKVAISSKKKQ